MKRSATDRWIAGVCGGLAKSWGCSAIVPRLLFAIPWHGIVGGVLVYAFLWAAFPEDGE